MTVINRNAINAGIMNLGRAPGGGTLEVGVMIEDDEVRKQFATFNGLEKVAVFLPQKQGESWKKLECRHVPGMSHGGKDFHNFVSDSSIRQYIDVDAIKQHGIAVALELDGVGQVWGQEYGQNWFFSSPR